MKANSYLTICLLSSVVATACTAELETEKMDESYEVYVSADGKADGRGLVSAAVRRDILKAVDDVVTQSDITIARIEADIAMLEAQNQAKLVEISALTQKIAARETELQNTYNDNLILCAFIPNPATCLFANYLANDSQMAEYKTLLRNAQSRKAQIEADVRAYQTKRTTARTAVAAIREQRPILVAQLDGNLPSPPAPIVLQGQTKLKNAFALRQGLAALTTGFQDEISLLRTLRDAAAELGAELDAAIHKITVLSTSVDRLVQQQNEQFLELLKAWLGGNASAHAQKWLENETAARTRAALTGLDIDTREFIEHLLAGDAQGADEALFDSLIEKLGAGTYPIATVTTPLKIIDLKTIESKVRFDAVNFAPLHSKVRIHIDHTFVGDLELALVGPTRTYELQQQLGGADDSIHKTFTISIDAADVANASSWTLRVKDVRLQDHGTVKWWSLSLQP